MVCEEILISSLNINDRGYDMVEFCYFFFSSSFEKIEFNYILSELEYRCDLCAYGELKETIQGFF